MRPLMESHNVAWGNEREHMGNDDLSRSEVWMGKRLVGVKRSPDTVVPLQCNYGLRSLHACFSEYGLSTEGKPDMLESG